MARHINVQFRQEYVQAGQNYCSSTSNNETQHQNENSVNNKRKDLSSDDLETSSIKIIKSKIIFL